MYQFACTFDIFQISMRFMYQFALYIINVFHTSTYFSRIGVSPNLVTTLGEARKRMVRIVRMSDGSSKSRWDERRFVFTRAILNIHKTESESPYACSVIALVKEVECSQSSVMIVVRLLAALCVWVSKLLCVSMEATLLS